MSQRDPQHLIDLSQRLVSSALDRGAEIAEARASSGWELTTKVRLGETDLVREAGHLQVYLKVLRDQRSATSSTSDVSEAGLARCVNDAIELLDLCEPDPHAGPADPALLYRGGGPELELYDPAVESIDASQAIARARAAEAAALGADPRITLSQGASFTRVSGSSALVLSSGFSGAQTGSYASSSVIPVVLDTGNKRRRGVYWTAARHLADLEDPVAVGVEAARRTLQQLGPRKIPSGQAPVIFDPETARSIIGTFAGCVLGGALWRKSSYLLDRVGTAVASPLVTLVDDPFVVRGSGSRLYDGDGLPSRRNVVVENGVLMSYLLDTYSARKLGLPCTHSGVRGGASTSSSTTNFVMQPGSLSAAELIAQTPRALYVTDLMGHGFNAITGDFSQGASGFWVENGELAFPVSEITISGNLDEMLRSIDAVGSDLDRRSSVMTPSFRVAQMTISGT